MQLANNAPGLLIENDRVRVLRGFIKAGDVAEMHSHPDHVIYVLRGANVRLTFPSGKSETMNLEGGKAMFLDAQSHKVENIGATDFEFVVFELK